MILRRRASRSEGCGRDRRKSPASGTPSSGAKSEAGHLVETISQHIFFESADDFLRFLGRKAEFDALARAATQLRSRFPLLDPWIRANPQIVVEIAPNVDGLIEVLSWFHDHPRPGLFLRELPVPVHTKFIENHERVLREWFDLILPAHTIRSDEEHFERRYGIRYAEPHLLLRFLDSEVQSFAGFPCNELSLPLHTLARLSVPTGTVFIVENKVNLLALALRRRARAGRTRRRSIAAAVCPVARMRVDPVLGRYRCGRIHDPVRAASLLSSS